MHAKADPEDPQAKAQRLAEQARADAAFTDNEQDLLTKEMQIRTRRIGTRVALAGVGGAGLTPNMGNQPFPLTAAQRVVYALKGAPAGG